MTMLRMLHFKLFERWIWRPCSLGFRSVGRSSSRAERRPILYVALRVANSRPSVNGALCVLPVAISRSGACPPHRGLFHGPWSGRPSFTGVRLPRPESSETGAPEPDCRPSNRLPESSSVVEKNRPATLHASRKRAIFVSALDPFLLWPQKRKPIKNTSRPP